jgi:hypothetical protein
MELISEDKKGVYLFIACYNSEEQKTNAFIAVTKAMLFDEVAIEMENLGDHAILFTSSLPLIDIKEKLKITKTHYLLIDLSVTYDLESICGFLPESQIELIKNMNSGVFSKEKPHLKRKLEDSVKNENYELAASLRDLTK